MPLSLLQGSRELLPQVHLLLLVCSQLQLQLGNLCCGSCQLLCNFGLYKMEQGRKNKGSVSVRRQPQLFSQEELTRPWRCDQGSADPAPYRHLQIEDVTITSFAMLLCLPVSCPEQPESCTGPPPTSSPHQVNSRSFP